MKELEKNLKESLHLSVYEVRLYIAGLNTELTLTQIARVANIPRTAAYSPLKKLVGKGLMSKIKLEKRVRYSSLDPQLLDSLIELDKTKLGMAVEQLSRKIEIPNRETSVQYFSGINGIQVASEILLNKSGSKLWKTVENPKHGLDKLGDKAFEVYKQKRVEKNINGRAIIPSNSVTSWVKKQIEKAREELIDIIVVSENEYAIEGGLAIAGDYVLMTVIEKLPFAILIENKELARTFESMHDMVWDRYRGESK